MHVHQIQNTAVFTKDGIIFSKPVESFHSQLTQHIQLSVLHYRITAYGSRPNNNQDDIDRVNNRNNLRMLDKFYAGDAILAAINHTIHLAKIKCTIRVLVFCFYRAACNADAVL